MIEIVHIQEIKDVQDCVSPIGQDQKKIWFFDSKGRSISGWVMDSQYVDANWKEGKEITLDITVNGKYTNFKLADASSASGPLKKPAPDVWAAVNSIKKRLDIIEQQLGIGKGNEGVSSGADIDSLDIPF